MDFHRPIDPPPDIAGASEPDRRIYFATGEGQVGELIPALYEQVTQIPMPPTFAL